jgi:hypothetical protein
VNRWLAATVVLALGLTAACSGGSDKSSAKPEGGSATPTTAKARPPVSLSPGIPRSEQFCSFPIALSAKLKGAKRPNGPEQAKPFIHDLATLFAQAAPAAPPQLAADVEKLNQFYTSLSQRLDAAGAASAPGPLPGGLADLTDSTNRLREYFRTVCGVNDDVFNFFS